MKIQEKMRKPMLEARYLNVENTDRYRPIIRLFYLKYEKLKYWMYQEDVFEELKEDPYFQEYTMEQCQQDLAALASWGNLLTIQDTRKVTTIEEFKNKKFRYQLSETAVEVERMVIRIENLLIEGSSLEPTLLERLRISLGRLGEMSQAEAEKRYGWWNDLNSDFIRLNQNYQDYMRELNSVKAEEMMKTKEFLVFKDRLIEYLRSFVKSLQVNVTAIEQQLRSVDREVVNQILQKVTEYELSIPRMDTEIDEQMIYEYESLGTDYGYETLENVRLYQGTQIIVSGGTELEVSTENAQMNQAVSKTENPLDPVNGTVEVTDRALVAGIDFPEGSYDIWCTDSFGVVSLTYGQSGTDDYETYGSFLIQSEKDAQEYSDMDDYAVCIYNVNMKSGMSVYAGGTPLKLVPSQYATADLEIDDTQEGEQNVQYY